MIDQDKVKRFWEARGETSRASTFESLGNLENDRTNLQRKIEDETTKVFSWLPDLRGSTVLDLGAGAGQWAFRFAERGAQRVLAVEYASTMAETGLAEGRQRGLEQVSYQVCAAETFETEEAFDLVFISGLVLYLNDDQVEALLPRLHRFVKPGGLLMVRDGTGVDRRHEINDRYSEHLQAHYSAIYRTRDQYVEAITRGDLCLLRDETMFPEGHPLNKFPETRLRLFLFRKPA